ncbi:GTP cyclohydrolase 1 type 2 NIF3L1, partial [Asbolus verrucosus]
MLIKNLFLPISAFTRSNFVAAGVSKMGMPTQEIVKSLLAYAPLSLAESWDNVGLLVDPMSDSNVSTILLTNDLTEDVVDEAVNAKAGLIVSYHPNIFRGLKSVSASTWKERIVVKCIKNEIAVFSPHTSWDCVEGGVNDWLASAFSFKGIRPINISVENPHQGAGRLLNLEVPLTVQEIVDKVKEKIGIKHLRLALARHKGADTLVSSVALCAGSGSSVLKGVEADLYLTGEMLHHDILDATQNGIHVILCNHSDSERGFLK